MGTKNKRNIWVSTPNSRFWEFLSVPNFKSLALLSTLGLLATSTSVMAADEYDFGYPNTRPPMAKPTWSENELNSLNPNSGAEIAAPDRDYINDNARLEDTRPLVQNYSDAEANIIPMNQRPGYFMEDGGSKLTPGGNRPR